MGTLQNGIRAVVIALGTDGPGLSKQWWLTNVFVMKILCYVTGEVVLCTT